MTRQAQKAALTRAIKTVEPEQRQWNVLKACLKAVTEWNMPGSYWPDDWSTWQRALDDAYAQYRPAVRAPRLEDESALDVIRGNGEA